MHNKLLRLFFLMNVLLLGVCFASCSHDTSTHPNTLQLTKALDEMEKSLPSDRRSITNGILKDVASTLSERYDMKCTGFGGGWLGDKILSLSFKIHRTVKKKEARAMLVDCVQEFIAAVNSNKPLKPYLDSQVFADKNIRLHIFVNDSKGSRIYHPDICVFGSYEGLISYRSEYPNSYNYEMDDDETFQKALSILKEENKGRT